LYDPAGTLVNDAEAVVLSDVGLAPLIVLSPNSKFNSKMLARLVPDNSIVKLAGVVISPLFYLPSI
jgi:hypothetical protein